MAVKKTIYFIWLLCLLSMIGFSQENFKSEDEQKRQADLFFKQENYSEALPLYSQLLAVHSEDPLYNYRYGVCLLFADRKDLAKPEKFIEKSAPSMKQDPLFNYHAGLASWYNDQFTKAIGYFNAYLSGNTDPQKAGTAQKAINHCKYGEKLSRQNNITAIKSTFDATPDNFYRSYSQDDLPGKILSRPSICTSSIDQDKEPDKMIFLPESRDYLYYSSYGEDHSGSRDIYMLTRLGDGEWGQPLRLGPEINSDNDEDYPVLCNGGNTLLFCSAGHSSIGGYDIFRSDIDKATGIWGPAINVGLKINSAFDDFLLIPSKTGQEAWFTSNRSAIGNNVKVYKIILSGSFLDEPIPPAMDQKESIVTGNNTEDNVAITKEKSDNPESENEQKLRDKQRSNLLVDSAFAIIEQQKELLKRLRNIKDEAFTVANEKSLASSIRSEEAAAHYEKAVAAKSDDIAYQELSVANQLKSESMLLLSRADHARKIGLQLNRQIDSRQKLIEKAGSQAPAIQLTATQGNLASVETEFARFVTDIKQADTLKDFRSLLTAIKNDDTKYNLDLSKILFTLYREPSPDIPIVTRQENPSGTNEIPVTKSQDQPVKKTDDHPVVVRDQGMSKDEKVKIETDIAHYVSFIDAYYSKIVKQQSAALIQSKNELDHFNNRMKMLYEHYLINNSVKNSLQDSLKSLLPVCRKAVSFYILYEYLDSLASLSQKDYTFSSETRKLVETGNHTEAKSRLSKLISISGNYVNMPDQLKVFLKALPQPKESTLGQAKQYADLALKYETEYEQLMDEGDLIQEKADKKKDGSKKDELTQQAEEVYEKAQLKKENAEKNQVKARNAKDSYNYALNYSKSLNEVVSYLLTTDNPKEKTPEDISELASVISIPIGNFRTNMVFIDTTIYLGKLFNELESPATPVFAKNIFNIKGLQYKLNAYSVVTRLAQAQVGLLTQLALNSTDTRIKTYSNSRISNLNSDLARNQELYNAVNSQIEYFDHKPAIVAFDVLPDDSLFLKKIREKESETRSQSEAWKSQMEQGTGIYTPEYSQLYIKGLESQLSDLVEEKEEMNHVLHCQVYLKNQLLIEHLRYGLPENTTLKKALTNLDEAAFLMQKAGKNRSEALGKPVNDAKYQLADANTFELAAIEQQGIAIEILRDLNPDSELIVAGLADNPFRTDFIQSANKEIAANDEKAVKVQEKEPSIKVSTESGSSAGISNIKPDQSGIVYRVQLLATGKTMKPDDFKGIQPISVEKAPNNIQRYLGGEFSNIQDASSAKDKYVKLGFSSAFVVAFYNGSKISLQEASKLAVGQPVQEKPASRDEPVVVKEEKIADMPLVSGTKIPATTETVIKEDKKNEPVEEKNIPVVEQPGPVTGSVTGEADITAYQGAAYFIQMGIFNSSKKPADLYGVDPLYRENLGDGKIKYYAGPYTDRNEASKKRNELESKGCKGAFMVAWNNGKKIKPDEMPVVKVDTRTVAETKTVAEKPIEKPIEKPVIEQKNDITEQPQTNITTTHEKQAVSFGIQLGAFKETKPASWIQEMKTKTGSEVNLLRQDSGIYLAVAGSFNSLEEASTLKNQLVNKGFKDVFVIGLKEGKKINLQQAIDLSR